MTKRTNPRRVAGTTAAALLTVVLGGGAAYAATSPAPIPGGANQIAGVSGTFASVLFNGTLRVRAMSLQNPGPNDNVHANAAGERPLVFRAIVSNGTHHENHGYFDATLSDADGITVTGRPIDDGWSLEPGSAARTAIAFSLPAQFVPVKLVLVQAAAPHARAFRMALRAQDLPPS
ncbi:hypothetical protein [Vulcanimicrobium alpinum]|nr:hypothetical protein [Vulcanimicrobium alpinum]